MSKKNEKVTHKKLLGRWDFIFLLGVSGGGKGTLVNSIKNLWLPDLVSHSMGDLVRKRSGNDPQIKALLESGTLISNDMVIDLFKDFASSSKEAGLMDGFPRNKAQASEVVKYMEKRKWKGLVIELSCDLETILERLLARGRADDKLDVMFKRHEDYKTLHPPVMAKLRKRDDLFDFISLDGNYDAHEVLTNFLLSTLRLVDTDYIRKAEISSSVIKMQQDDTDVNPMITRFICNMFKSVEEIIAEEDKEDKESIVKKDKNKTKKK